MNKGVSKQFNKKLSEAYSHSEEVRKIVHPEITEEEFGNTLSPDAQKEVDRINFVESFNPQPKKGKK